MIKKLLQQSFYAFLYGNSFIALAGVLLCIETNLQHQLPLNYWLIYFFIFCCINFYYTYLYNNNLPKNYINKQIQWYIINKKIIIVYQIILFIFICICLVYFLLKFHATIFQFSLKKWGYILLFPIIAIMYYFNVLSSFGIKNLRQYGWLKPFVIAYVWSGLVGIYPFVFLILEHQINYLSNFHILDSYWLNNFIYFMIIAMLFDIKDVAYDHKKNIKTYPVLLGVKFTIHYIIIPICIVATSLILIASVKHHFTFIRILVNIVPYLLLIFASISLIKHKKNLYYLFFIDGLLFIKSITGILIVVLIK